jgi:hypothetical protein
MKMRDTVFISYCHVDDEYRRRLRVHLAPLEKAEKFKVWDDAINQPGDRWRDSINTAMKNAFAAILLISADFLNSDFIVNNELPYLLEAAEKNEIRIIPIILKEVALDTLESFELSKFQYINDPKQTVDTMQESKQEALWARTSSLILKEWKNVCSVFNTMHLKETPDYDFPPFSSTEDIENEMATANYMKKFADPLHDDDAGLLFSVQIEKIRPVPHGYRCYKLNKLIENVGEAPKENETHWLFYHASRFQDLHIGDKINIKITKIDGLRNWNDLPNARNIYISELYLITDMKKQN